MVFFYKNCLRAAFTLFLVCSAALASQAQLSVPELLKLKTMTKDQVASLVQERGFYEDTCKTSADTTHYTQQCSYISGDYDSTASIYDSTGMDSAGVVQSPFYWVIIDFANGTTRLHNIITYFTNQKGLHHKTVSTMAAVKAKKTHFDTPEDHKRGDSYSTKTSVYMVYRETNRPNIEFVRIKPKV